MTIELLKQKIETMPPIVFCFAVAIYVYGSMARNEDDDDSDCDIFLCINDCKETEYYTLKSAIREWEYNSTCEVSIYQISQLTSMQQKGSYFLWHIKKEGILLYEKNITFRKLLDGLKPYQNVLEDFKEYDEILNDIQLSVSMDSATIDYELAILAVLARNICIGCCFLIGDMDFGRRTPIIKCADFFGADFPFSTTEYDALYDYRLADTRGKVICKANCNAQYAQVWIDKIKILHDLAMRLVR